MRPSRFVIAVGNYFFRTRNLIFPVVFAVLALAFRPHYPREDERLDLWLDLVGLAVALLGQGLRFAVIGFAYVKRGGKDKKIYADRLVQEGFFAHSRNPLYVGNILVLFGLMIIHNSPWMYVFGLAFYGFAYISITLAEEEFLRGKFGDEYDEYCRRVNRFLPSLRGLSKSVDGMQYDWRRVVRKEYGSTFTWLLTVLALLVWERISHGGYAHAAFEINLIALLLVPLCAFYAWARYLKKARLLGMD